VGALSQQMEGTVPVPARLQAPPIPGGHSHCGSQGLARTGERDLSAGHTRAQPYRAQVPSRKDKDPFEGRL
jgi:hypothetical protein